MERLRRKHSGAQQQKKQPATLDPEQQQRPFRPPSTPPKPPDPASAPPKLALRASPASAAPANGARLVNRQPGRPSAGVQPAAGSNVQRAAASPPTPPPSPPQLPVTPHRSVSFTVPISHTQPTRPSSGYRTASAGILKQPSLQPSTPASSARGAISSERRRPAHSGAGLPAQRVAHAAASARADSTPSTPSPSNLPASNAASNAASLEPTPNQPRSLVQPSKKRKEPNDSVGTGDQPGSGSSRYETPPTSVTSTSSAERVGKRAPPKLRRGAAKPEGGAT
ncbi:MAG: hypothetical protein INR71_03710 [Terriglobus roseus]|nr:hypothetical protein [Terriglobus roseus]